jgi:hypothetical protein
LIVAKAERDPERMREVLTSLARRVQHEDRRFSLTKCFDGRFRDQLLIKSYLEIREEVLEPPHDKPVVMIIKWPYVKHGVAIHERGFRNDDGFMLRQKVGGREIVLERFSQLLDAIAARWTPAERRSDWRSEERLKG